MKASKNNFDIHFDNFCFCRNCSFQIRNVCKWLRIVGKGASNCGGTRSNNLSDIFTL